MLGPQPQKSAILSAPNAETRRGLTRAASRSCWLGQPGRTAPSRHHQENRICRRPRLRARCVLSACRAYLGRIREREFAPVSPIALARVVLVTSLVIGRSLLFRANRLRNWHIQSRQDLHGGGDALRESGGHLALVLLDQKRYHADVRRSQCLACSESDRPPLTLQLGDVSLGRRRTRGLPRSFTAVEPESSCRSEIRHSPAE